MTGTFTQAGRAWRAFCKHKVQAAPFSWAETIEARRVMVATAVAAIENFMVFMVRI